MRAFNVQLNGKKLCLAGVRGNGVLSAMVVWAERGKSENPFIEVGGLANEEQQKWIKQRHLRVGDEIRIRVVETNSIDKPVERMRPDPAERLRATKRYVRLMAKDFGWKIQPRSKRSAS